MKKMAVLLVLIFLILACGPSPLAGEEENPLPPTPPPVIAEEPTSTAAPPQAGAAVDKFALWANGTHLRGANIYQRRVYPELVRPSNTTGSGQ
jgi:hypothetical protein